MGKESGRENVHRIDQGRMCGTQRSRQEQLADAALDSVSGMEGSHMEALERAGMACWDDLLQSAAEQGQRP